MEDYILKAKELKRNIEFITAFGVTIEDKEIHVDDSHLSVVLNKDCEWSDFLGYSVYEIAEVVATELGFTVKFR